MIKSQLKILDEEPISNQTILVIYEHNQRNLPITFKKGKYWKIQYKFYKKIGKVLTCLDCGIKNDRQVIQAF